MNLTSIVCAAVTKLDRVRARCDRDLHVTPAKGAGKTKKIAINIHFPMVRRHTQMDVCLWESGMMGLTPDGPGWGYIDVMVVDHNWTIGIMNM
jgi:hypothetical protein